MKPPFRPFRSRLTRLLASMLVAVSLLLNGLAAAEAASMAAGKDCCAERMGHGGHAAATDEHKGCPPSANDRCDDQCQMRCQVNTALPVFAVALPRMILQQTVLPLPGVAAWALPEPEPGLRPPIFA
jgi:hypothetical protein